MASTYSANLALDLMANGDQSGTWGTTNNTNLGTLIEQAISGYVTQAITDGSGANTTITIPNGATGVARNMFIEMTGALTFSTTSLIVPANKKMYFIYNNTTGGFAVTVKVSGQTGILVPNGKKVVLTSNGTDIVEAHTAIVGNATMGGTLGITGTTTAAAINASGTVAMAGAATVGTTLGVTGATTLSSTLGVTGAITGTGGNWNNAWSSAGSVVDVGANNTSTAASSNARLLCNVTATSTGDPTLLLSITGTKAWSVGIDNSNSDIFCISEDGVPGTTDRLQIAAGGAVSIPGTLGVTGNITGSGADGFKTGANNTGLYFNGSRNAILGSNAADTVTIAAANANVAVFGAASTSLTGTLGVTGLITGVAGLVAEDTTAISVAGTGNDIRIGTIGNSAITSTADLFVAYLGSSNPLNPSGVNGSLLLASRNNAGAEVVLAATNTVSLRAKSSGVTIPETLGVGNAGNSGIQLYVTATGTKYGLYMDGSSGVMLYSGINSQTFTSGESATNSALYVRKDSTSSRSISAAGTINASGADYAEYESNGGLVIAKGDVVGFSADGVLTLKFSEAVRFGIKSTNPSYVGGDTFASADALGEHPRHAAIGNEDADEAELAEDIAAYELRLEAARQLVDRVAYSGKVPVNVLDATAGGYIIASDDGGKIAGAFVADVNFEQYKRVVGRVNRVLPDGRAEVAVIVH